MQISGSILVLLMVISKNIGFAQKVGHNFVVDFSVESTTIGFIEPIYYEFSVRNLSNKKLTILKPSYVFYTPMIEYRAIGDTEWEAIHNSTTPDFGGLRSRPQVLIVPGEKQEMDGNFIGYYQENYFKNKRTYCFEEGKEYLLRGNYGVNNKGERILTKEVQLSIERYKNEDKKVVEWLMQLSEPLFLFNSGSFTLKDKKNTTYIIENYPGSKFKEWAELQLLIYSVFTESQYYKLYQLQKTKPSEEELLIIYEQNIKEKKENIIQFEAFLPKVSQGLIKKIIKKYIKMIKGDIEIVESLLKKSELD